MWNGDNNSESSAEATAGKTLSPEDMVKVLADQRNALAAEVERWTRDYEFLNRKFKAARMQLTEMLESTEDPTSDSLVFSMSDIKELAQHLDAKITREVTLELSVTIGITVELPIWLSADDLTESEIDVEDATVKIDEIDDITVGDITVDSVSKSN